MKTRARAGIWWAIVYRDDPDKLNPAWMADRRWIAWQKAEEYFTPETRQFARLRMKARKVRAEWVDA